jgi:hypothetical protein
MRTVCPLGAIEFLEMEVMVLPLHDHLLHFSRPSRSHNESRPNRQNCIQTRLRTRSWNRSQSVDLFMIAHLNNGNRRGPAIDQVPTKMRASWAFESTRPVRYLLHDIESISWKTWQIWIKPYRVGCTPRFHVVVAESSGRELKGCIKPKPRSTIFYHSFYYSLTAVRK